MCRVCAVVSLVRSFNSPQSTLYRFMRVFSVFDRRPPLRRVGERGTRELVVPVSGEIAFSTVAGQPVIACVNLETTFFARVRNGDRGFEVEEA